MDLIDRLKGLSDRIPKIKEQVQTEEATKNAFIMPFIASMGYDVFNPMEVVPEYTADIGTKKGEKVDYCILKDNEPIIIIECKHWKENLSAHNSQLHRYFHVTDVRFAILTNGITYQFYSDMVEKNKMDEKAFFEFSMEDVSEGKVNELKKFSKDGFNINEILETASDLKYSKLVKELLLEEFNNPSEDFIKFCIAKVYPGRATTSVKDQFYKLIQASTKQLINEAINQRLQKAIDNSEPQPQTTEVTATNETTEETNSRNKGIETTEEELQSYRIVQSILRKSIDIDRISYKDTKSYFNVLFENNTRKPICRIYLNRSVWYLGVFDENKDETKHVIEKLEDIYKHEEALLATVARYNEG